MKRVLAFLALVATIIGAASPDGFMPGRGANGVIVLKLCSDASGHPGRTITLAKNDTGDVDDDARGNHCDFGSPGAAAMPRPPLALLARPVPLQIFTDHRPALTGIFPASMPPSTGPPAA